MRFHNYIYSLTIFCTFVHDCREHFFINTIFKIKSEAEKSSASFLFLKILMLQRRKGSLPASPVTINGIINMKFGTEVHITKKGYNPDNDVYPGIQPWINCIRQHAY